MKDTTRRVGQGPAEAASGIRVVSGPPAADRSSVLDEELVRTVMVDSSGEAMPPLDGATRWLSSPPLSKADLRGRVVLVNFWTYSCINWIRTLPHLRAWWDAYRDSGLVVIGVHTPEFDFEHDPDRVRRATRAFDIGYPIAVDDQYAVWDAFANDYWPASYFVDAEGCIRHHRFGEGDELRSEAVIRRLLQEAGTLDAGLPPVSVVPAGVEAPADWGSLRSPETYLGYARATNLASPSGLMLDRPHAYEPPSRLHRDHWALTGVWVMGPQALAPAAAGGRIAYRHHSRDVHLVMGPAAPGAPVRFRVTLDGGAPRDAHGLDVDEGGYGTVTEHRLHQLVRQPGPVDDRTFEIEFLDPGVQAYVFTFG